MHSSKPGRRSSEELNVIELIRSYMKRARLWWRHGDSPPPTHYWSLGLALFLVASGILTILGLFSSSQPDPPIPGQVMRAAGRCALGTVILAPGVYCLFLSLCCWRRLGGYDWWMIPHFG
jgi:hypothetical protein